MSLIGITQHSQEADIPAPDGIRTRNPSKQAAADPLLRPRGHCRRPITIIISYESYSCLLETMRRWDYNTTMVLQEIDRNACTVLIWRRLWSRDGLLWSR